MVLMSESLMFPVLDILKILLVRELGVYRDQIPPKKEGDL